jgi:hypothetical protein
MASAASLATRVEEHVQTMARESGFTELTMRGIRQAVGKAVGQEMKSKVEKALVKAAVEQVLASPLFTDPASGQVKAPSSDGVRRESDANVFTQPTSPPTEAGGEPSLAAAALGVYRCVKKAVLRETAELSSAKRGTLQPGETIVAVESLRVDGPGTLQRVRCERGWTSILSSSGNVLLEPTAESAPEAAAEATAEAEPSTIAAAETASAQKESSPKPSADSSPASSPEVEGSNTAARKRKRLSLGLSDEEEDEDEDDTVLPAPSEVEWVQCEEAGCGKWRRLPAHIKAADLPDRFVCTMNHWDTARASCEAAEEAEHNEQPAEEEDEQDEAEADASASSSAGRRGSSRNKSVGRLTDAQQKAVARLKNRDTLSTIAALGDEEEEEPSDNEDEMEHVERDHFVQAKAAKKRPAAAAASGAAADSAMAGGLESPQASEADDDYDSGPSQAVSKKPRRAAAEKQMAAQSSIFYDDAMEDR